MDGLVGDTTELKTDLVFRFSKFEVVLKNLPTMWGKIKEMEIFL